MRLKFEEQLEALNVELIEMGALCESAIANAAKALIQADVDLAKRAMQADEEIDRKEKDIERLCLKLLLQQQPVAKDLRLISSALKMITDMERIGDQAADISEIVLLENSCPCEDTLHIRDMAVATIKMVTESIDAFVHRDIGLACSVIDYDDVVDHLFTTIKAALVDLILQTPEKAEYALDLLMVAKYFERIGDHAVNIAQWVEFSITGSHRNQ